MNVFILNTGRCGSTTLVRACEHIRNYTAGHETRSSMVGPDRLAFPDNHIEADNRLSWFLGRLDRAFGNSAMYVHLQRDRDATARSFAQRRGSGIMRAYEKGLLMRGDHGHAALDVAHDYCETVERNIECFLKDKTQVLSFRLEHAEEDFRALWQAIGAEGDLQAALGEFRVRHNASQGVLAKFWRKLRGA